MQIFTICRPRHANQRLKKIIIIMKLTTLLMILGCLHLNAAVFSQSINISERNVSLETVFAKIEKQTGYLFFTKVELIREMPKVNVNFKNLPLRDALEELLGKLSLSYTIFDKNIVIKPIVPKTGNRVENAPLLILGVVQDESSKPIPGANIKVKGTMQNVVTDTEGKFRIIVVSMDAVLQVSYIGYVTREIDLKDFRNPMVITLKTSTSDLDQVQITAYGSTTKRLNTGNTITIGAAEIAKHPVTNVLQILKDRVPGMFVEQRTGLPGGSFNVQIRGNSSYNKNSPLFIIDGVAYPGGEELPLVKPGGNRNQFLGGDALNYINNGDIESIDILKDADATAIYGSRGAYGVVIITTKKGKGGAPKLSINSNVGFMMRNKLPQMLNTQDYLMLRREAFKNDNLTPGVNDLDVNGTWPEDKYTNWQQELLGKSAVVNDISASYSGGANNINFLMSGTYHNEASVAKGKGSNRGGNARFNINTTSLNQKFSIDVGGSYNSTVNDVVPIDFSGDVGTISAPNAPSLLLPDGNLNWERGSNPYAALNLDYKQTANNILASTDLVYKPVKGLSLKTRIGFNQLTVKEFRSTPSTYFNPATIATELRNTTSYVNNIGSRTWSVDPFAVYEIAVGKKGKLTVTAGANIQDKIETRSVITGTDFISDALLINPALGGAVASTYDAATFRQLGMFTTVNYNWNNKYILNLTGRRDGSTKFGPGNRFGNFWAVGATYIITEEKWIKENLPFLSFAKIRGSYGLAGGDGIPNYIFLPRYVVTSGPNGYQGNASFSPTTPENRNLHWETKKTTDVQMLLEFLKGRISIDGTYYKGNASDLLVQFPLASMTGATQFPSNSDVLIQNTGYEIALITKNISGRNFKWSSNFSVTKDKNVLKYFPTLKGLLQAFDAEVGKSTQGVKVYKYSGVDPETGNYFFTNAAGVTAQHLFFTLTQNDKTEFIDKAPVFYGMVTNSLSYKSFSLDFSISVRRRNGLNYLGQQQFTFGQFNQNSSVSVLDRWQKPGDITDVPKVSTNGLNSLLQLNNFRQSTGAYELITYARLQNASLSYNFNPALLKKIRVNNLSVFLRGENLLSVSKYGDMDPESLAVTATPPLRVFTFGMNVTL